MDINTLYAIFLQHPVISTDTRKITPGCLFFALKGSNFDGNAFAAQALQSGASYAIVSDSSLVGPRFIHTEDTLATLQSLANHHRRQFHIPVLAITGSNGKTTTKELVTAVLSKKYKVHATKGNLNNHIGVPLTLLGITPDVEIVVCEMGANHPGEIGRLCEIAEPTHGLITNIGKAHLEGFGSMEGVKKAKGELFAYLSRNEGLCFINTDDPNLLDLGSKLTKKKTYGFDASSRPEVHFEYLTSPDKPGFLLKKKGAEVILHSTMFGYYNAINVLAAYAVGNHFNVSDQQVAEAILHYIPGANRSEITTFREAIIIKDAYNANPSSMELALSAFASQYPSGWVVLGDMKELGPESPGAHRQIIDKAISLPVERIYLVGEAFRDALAHMVMNDPRIYTAHDVLSLKEKWNWAACRGKAVMLKGSRSMQLELLLEPGTE